MFLTSPTTVADRAIQAQHALRQGFMHFELHTRTRDKVSFLRGDIDFKKGTSLTLKIANLIPGYQTSRIYRVEGSHVMGYDYFADEALYSAAPSSDSLGARLQYVIGTLPDPVASVADPSWLPKFLHGLGPLDKFKETENKKGCVLERRGTSRVAGARLVFNSNHLLTQVSSTAPNGSFIWSISYTGRPVPFSIPDGAPVVKAFHPHLPLPKFADAKTKNLSIKVLRAARKLKPSKIVVKRPDRLTVIFWKGGKLRQENSRGIWAYNGKELSVIVGKNFYRGKASHADVLDYLAYLTNGEDSFSRSLLLRTNPLQDFFDPNSVVTIKGTMTKQGIASTILEIKGPATKSSLIIKDSSYLVESASTDALGSGGRVLQHDEAEYQYLPLPSGGSDLFELLSPLHAKTKKLPKNAIHINYGSFHSSNGSH